MFKSSFCRHFILLLICCLNGASTPFLNGQASAVSPKAYARLAKKALEAGKKLEAAQLYEKAWVGKPQKLDYLAQAAQLFEQERAYEKAAEAFKKLKSDKKFPLSGLQYAYMLQKSGQFDEAIPEFLLYLNNYESADREAVSERIEQHIAGCTLGIKQSEKNGKDSSNTAKIQFEHLSESINSPSNDFAPLPFNNDVLYFAHTMPTQGDLQRGQNQFLRTQLVGGEWAAAATVQNLPISEGSWKGEGSFSPDGSRFYFSQFTGAASADKPRASALFMLRRTADGWSKPIRLRAYVSPDGVYTGQPHVFHLDGKEFLYFVSDRSGGQGGSDIWFTTRPLAPDDVDFDIPQNAGLLVNTPNDEITPFFDAQKLELYFSSDKPQRWVVSIFSVQKPTSTCFLPFLKTSECLLIQQLTMRTFCSMPPVQAVI
jgi:tetratricopeptide (TPR) repeat protein